MIFELSCPHATVSELKLIMTTEMPSARILSVVREKGADVIGLSGLITPSRQRVVS
jgi:cobalamin-dependent methionine synthase I